MEKQYKTKGAHNEEISSAVGSPCRKRGGSCRQTRRGGDVLFVNYNNFANTHAQCVIETPRDGGLDVGRDAQYHGNPDAIKRKDQTQTALSIRDQYSVTAQPWSFVEVILDRSNQRLPVMINHCPVSAASAETGFVSEKSMQRTDI